MIAEAHSEPAAAKAGDTVGSRQATTAVGAQAVAARRPAPDAIKRVAVIGVGIIGALWTALFLANGLDVSVADPAPCSEQRLRADDGCCRPALARLGLAGALGDGSAGGRLAFFEEIEDAVRDAEFVQESVGDADDLKLAVFQRLDAACPPKVVIASSISGIMPSFLQSVCAHPERVLVGHPFNPVHNLPLVEVVPGASTAAEVVD